MNCVASLLRLARVLDEASMYEEADRVDSVRERVAQYGGRGNHFNVPVEDRMVPWKELGVEDAESDFWKHPRFRPSDMEATDDSASDMGKNSDKIVRLRVPTDKVEAIQKALYDIGGQGRVLSAKDEETPTPFNMDDRDPKKGGSEFHMHGDGQVGFQYVHHDSQSAGMAGIDKFTEKSQMQENLQSPYHRMLPQM